MKELMVLVAFLALIWVTSGCATTGGPTGPQEPTPGVPPGGSPAPRATEGAIPKASETPIARASETPAAKAAETPASKATDQGTSKPIPQEAEPQVAHAKQDLAQRLGVSVDSITVREVEEVEWRDSSLGCPEPGKAYLQVITPGYKIILEAQGKSYEYHTDRGKNVVLCQR